MNNLRLTLCALVLSTTATFSQVNSAKVYWVGHSLISSKDWSDPSAQNLIEMTGALATTQGKSYDYHKHTIPGAPIGWNWGTADSWAQVEPLIAPLTDQNDPQYGTFDVIVVTEGVNINSSYDWWNSGFYARKFYGAALNANPNARLYLYESWHHYHAGDFTNYYGPQETFDWIAYMKGARATWEAIADEAADPTMTPTPGDYTYQGAGNDPGDISGELDVMIVPTGAAFVNLIERLNEKRPEDNWYFDDAVHNDTLDGIDFFVNPLLNFPTDLSTTVTGESLDDIHPSAVLIYLNSLVHYAVIYEDDPHNLPASTIVPAPIDSIFKDVAWQTVINDPRSGVTDIVMDITEIEETQGAYPNPTSGELHFGKVVSNISVKTVLGNELVHIANASTIDISELPKGTYALSYLFGEKLVSTSLVKK